MKEDNRVQIELQDRNQQYEWQRWQAANTEEWRMMNAKNQQEWDMWNAQNAYNTPSAQLQRYRQAGINPQLAMESSPNSGMASKMNSADGSVPAGFSGQVPHLNPEPSIGDYLSKFAQDLNQTLNSYSQNKLIEAQAQKAQTEANDVKITQAYRLDLMRKEAMKTLADTDKTKVEKEQAAYDLAFVRSMESTRREQEVENLNQTKANTSHLRESEMLMRSQRTYQEIQNKYADSLSQKQLEKLEVEIRRGTAEIGLIGAQTHLTRKQAEHEAERITTTILQNGGLAKDFRDYEKVHDAIYQQMMLDVEHSRNRNTLEAPEVITASADKNWVNTRFGYAINGGLNWLGDKIGKLTPLRFR